MLKFTKILTALVSVAVVIAAWATYTTVSVRLDADQKQLCDDAEKYLSRKIYDTGTDLLVQALNIRTDRNPDIWRRLADSYKIWGEGSKYRDTLSTMINNNILTKDGTLADLYEEAYEYDLPGSSVRDILELLREGINKTDSGELKKIYNKLRFTTEAGRDLFDNAGIILNGAAIIERGGYYGYVNRTGGIIIGASFELATNFAYANRMGYAAVYKNGELYMIDGFGRRRALADDFKADEIARFNGAAFSVKLPGSENYVMAVWNDIPANPVLEKRDKTFEYYGYASDYITAIKDGGKWILSDSSKNIAKIPYSRAFDEVALDEFGRCAVNGAIFVKENGGDKYNMIDYAGSNIAGPFDDAKPFFEAGGLAAVKKDGMWGYVNSAGNQIIDFVYEDAGSSSSVTSSVSTMMIAPAKQGGKWGYITRTADTPKDGVFVIEPQYENAKQFVNGCAPVASEDGWYYIVLAEYAE